MAAAVAWVRKYLVVASTHRGWWLWAISGRMASVLISRPIQARSQWELIKVTVVPRPRLISRIERTYGFISTGRILTCMFGVWAQKLILAYCTLGSGVKEALRVLISSVGFKSLLSKETEGF